MIHLTHSNMENLEIHSESIIDDIKRFVIKAAATIRHRIHDDEANAEADLEGFIEDFSIHSK